MNKEKERRKEGEKERRETRDEKRVPSEARERGAPAAASIALMGVCAGSLLVTVAFASAWLPGGAPAWGAWLMILGSAKLLGSATMLGAVNSGARWPLALAAALFLSLVIVIGFGAPLLLPVETASSPLVLGLPLRAAIEIYAVGLLPIVVLPWLFAAEFRSDALGEDALTALRARCAAARPSTPP